MPQETLAQQVRSTQLFDTQSVAVRQLAPLAFFAGGPQVVPVQTFPVVQSAVVAQLAGQLPALQA